QLHSMRQYATQLQRPGKPEGKIDWHAQLRHWESTSRKHELGALTDLARVFWRGTQSGAQVRKLSPETERRVLAQAIAQRQDASAACGREALVSCIARNLPDDYLPPRPEDAAPVLDGLAAKASRTGELVRLDTGEWPRVPDQFRRASGESVF